MLGGIAVAVERLRVGIKVAAGDDEDEDERGSFGGYSKRGGCVRESQNNERASECQK